MKRMLVVASLFLNISIWAQTNDASWVRTYKGKIDKYAVTLHLHKAGRQYQGFYYYDSKNEPIAFSGEEDKNTKGSVDLHASGEQLQLQINGRSVSGKWKNAAGDKTLDFTATEIEMPLNFTYVYTEGNVQLRPKWKDSPAAGYYAAALWTNGKTPLDDTVRNAIRSAFGFDGGGEIGALLLRDKKGFLNSYVSDNKDIADSELKTSSGTFNFEQNETMLLLFQTEKLASLELDEESFTGGAHPNHGTTYVNFDLVAGRTITMPDIFTSRTMINALLEKHFRKQYNLKPTDSLTEYLFENRIEANDNFYLTTKGIGFHYNPYEIASYAVGDIEIFIPFSELKPYLKESFRKLIE